MKHYIQYFKYLMRHKIYYYEEARKANIGIYTALMHDVDKFRWHNFKSAADWFYGPYGLDCIAINDREIERRNQCRIRFVVWAKTHTITNPHHWNSWIGRTMPYKYITEMVCDWKAMGRDKGNTAVWFYINNYHNFSMTESTILGVEMELDINLSPTENYGNTLEGFAKTMDEDMWNHMFGDYIFNVSGLADTYHMFRRCNNVIVQESINV